MSAEVITSSPTKEQSEPVTKMDTSVDVPPAEPEPEPANGLDDSAAEPTNDTKAGKRKRPTKKPVDTDETSISNSRPKRTMSKREEAPATTTANGSAKGGKAKAQRQSVEQTAGDADDEQERDKSIPVLHDVADVVWVKMGGHPWWPSLVIRDPNDSTRCFTKVSGNARAKRMYFVVFYGSTADFAWVSDAAIIPYQGVEAFTKYAQESVDKAVTKSQKEQLTERFQLKVTIGRREDWEMAVREADAASKQTSETRLEAIDPKVQFYTSKLVTPKGQSGRRSKASLAKADESSETASNAGGSSNPNDRSLAEKTFEFKSDEESSEDEEAAPPVRKTPSMKIKLKKQASNDADSTTPPAKRRYVRKSNQTGEGAGEHEEAENGSHQLRTPTKAGSQSPSMVNGSAKKRGRSAINKPSVITNNGDDQQVESDSTSPSATGKATTPKRSITKPQAFTNKSYPVSSLGNVLAGQHHRFDIRTGFLSPFEEQEVFDAIDQLRPTKTFDEADQIARRRFEHILCLNLNRTHVDIPQEWFYTFLFSHPILIIKNPHWFNDKTNAGNLFDNNLINDVSQTQSSSSLAVLKHQLVILSKLYRNELQTRPAGTSSGKPKASQSKHEQDTKEENLGSV